jgi:hypothetical protein
MRHVLWKARILIIIGAFARICLCLPLHIAGELKPALERLGVLECFVCSRCPQSTGFGPDLTTQINTSRLANGSIR